VAQKTAWAWLIGTFFGIGKLKPGPGTWASVATVGLWRAFAPFADGYQVPAAIAAAALVTAIGIPAATRVARESGRKDPGFVVIDEVAGQLIALIGAPLHWKTLLASLILFRVFDILKPPPLRRLEDLPEGAGIMLDDVGAGIYALAAMQALRHFGLLP
jgi:phosphatidylglycerophosphatase A